MEHRYIEQVFNLTIENLKGVGGGDLSFRGRHRHNKR